MSKELSDTLKFQLDKSLNIYNEYLFSLSNDNLTEAELVLHRREGYKKLHDNVINNVFNSYKLVYKDNSDFVSLLKSSFDYISGKEFEIETKFYRFYENFFKS